jgi:predicted  nucleic acid-binding Zn-ribbon protein
VRTAREALERGGADTARELEESVRSTANLRDERSAIAAEVDEELLELYDDLREQKKGVGAAALVDGVCQGCHQKLSAMEIDRLKKMDGIRRCEYCRRILIPR